MVDYFWYKAKMLIWTDNCLKLKRRNVNEASVLLQWIYYITAETDAELCVFQCTIHGVCSSQRYEPLQVTTFAWNSQP